MAATTGRYKIREFDVNGDPLVGGLVYTYTTGTATPLATYTDSGGGTANANPVVLDARGEADIWLDDASTYRFILKTAADVTIWTVDGIRAGNVSGTLQAFTPYGHIAATNIQAAIEELVDDHAASDGSTLVGFLQSASVDPENLRSRGRWFAYVTDYLSDANRAAIRAGTSVNISSAVAAALAEFSVALLPPYGSYTFGSKVTIPANKGLVGFNKTNTIITKTFNGDMIDLSAAGSFIEGLTLEGDGATFTGKGVVLSTAASKQRIHSCKINDTAGACIAFDDKDAGSQFSGFDLELSRTNSGTGTGNYAVTISATQQLAATPRKFIHVETQGNCSFDFGGCNNVYIVNSTIGDVAYTADSRAVYIANSRLLNQATLTVDGFNNTIVGGAISPAITIAAGSGDNVIGPCSFNLSVTDNSGLGTNLITHKSENYTPVWTGASTNPAIGNGTITGHYTRNGDVIHATISIAMGSSTTFGSGEYSFSLPIATTVTARNFVGQVQGRDDSGPAYVAGACLLVTAIDADAVQCYQNTGATAFSPTVPITWADGDTLNISIDYIV
jgi:hypothetical protein